MLITMDPNLRSRIIHWTLRIFIVVWAALWYVAFKEFSPDRDVNEMLRHIGLAFGLAGFFGLTVDYYVKRQLADEIMHDTAPYIFTHGLPVELRDEVFSTREYKLIRRDLLVELRFSDLGAHLVLETTLSYSLENLAATTQDDVLGAAVSEDKHADVMPCEITFLEARGADITQGTCCQRPPKIPVQRATQPGEPAAKVVQPIKVRPNLGNVRNGLTVSTKTVFDRQDEELYFFRAPIIGLTVRVLDKPPGLRIKRVLVSHLPGAIEGEPPQDPVEWKFDRGLLPLSCLSIVWRWESASTPKNEPSVQKNDRPV